LITYLWLGSNLDDPHAQLDRAIELIQAEYHIKLHCLSSRIETAPFGYLDQPSYVNQVIRIDTELDCRTLLQRMQEIEKTMGREKTIHWGPRRIDIDILLADVLVINEPDLQVPHPELHKRIFVLQLLNELIPDYVHPLLGQSITALYTTFDPDVGVNQ